MAACDARTICLTAIGAAVAERPGVTATLALPRTFVEGWSSARTSGSQMPARQAVAPRRCARRVVRGWPSARATAYGHQRYRLAADAADTGKPGEEARDGGPRDPEEEQPLLLRPPGDPLIVTRDAAVGRPAALSAEDGRVRSRRGSGARMRRHRQGARRGRGIWFDDGRSAGGRVGAERHLLVRVTHARPGASGSARRRAINLPDTHMNVSALTNRDLADLAVVARHADIVASRSSGAWMTWRGCRRAWRGPAAAAGASSSRWRRDGAFELLPS